MPRKRATPKSSVVPPENDRSIASLEQTSEQTSDLTPDFLDTITDRIFQHIVDTYRQKVEELVQTQGINALDPNLTHVKIITDRTSGNKKIELLLKDPDRIQTYLKASLADRLSPNSPDSNSQYGQRIPRPSSPANLPHITHQLIQSLDLPNRSLQDIDKLLGINPKPKHTRISSHFDLDPIAVIPTAIPIASSIRAQLRPDLWQQIPDNDLAVFQYRSRSNPSNYIEHYITNPGDIDLLPWTAAEQIIDKFGFDTVKLQLIFAARTMEESEPWNSTFTVRATDIIHLLGWERNHSTNLPEKRNAVASTAYALSCLMVKSVWIEGRGKKSIDASTPIGRMWDVLIDPHGQIDWTTGKIEKPEEVYITISPGLWTKHYLNRAGSKAKEALHQFGYLAKDILKIDPYHNEMALRLAIQLTLDARIRIRNHNPYDYQVGTLLQDILPRTEIEEAIDDKYKSRDLKNRWNKSLELLISLGWQIEFDPDTYPEWLRPTSVISDTPSKPTDWRKVKLLERLLAAKLTIKPPHPIPGLLSTLQEPKKSRSIAPAVPTIDITGALIKQARSDQGWSRKELGGFLDLSADYIGKLERGDRFLTPELETKLRRLLKL
jgi:DNA-binding XRE family transcriptional regulator